VLTEKFGPSVPTVLARHAEVARQDEALLAELTRPLVERLVRAEETGITLDTADLSQAPPALQRRVVLEAIRRAGGLQCGFDEALAVIDVAMGEREAVDLPGGIRASRHGAALALTAGPGRQRTVPAFRYRLPIPGSVWVPEARRTVRAEHGGAGTPDIVDLTSADGGTAVIRADDLATDLFVRSWQPGDVMRPLGLGGRKKLQDVFVDRKVPRLARHRMPVVVDADDRIVWVPGHALDEEYRVTGDTRAVVVLTMRQFGGRE
jgi:tRNA(Ile)-lysidine synthase